MTRSFTTMSIKRVQSLELPIEDLRKMRVDFPYAAKTLYQIASKQMLEIQQGLAKIKKLYPEEDFGEELHAKHAVGEGHEEINQVFVV